MENATKGLMIAGAILIAIVLIGIGVLLVTQGQNFIDEGTGQFDEMTVQAFNSKYDQYEGKRKGADVKALITQINTNNMNAINEGLEDEKLILVSFDKASDVSDSKDLIAIRSQVNSGKDYNIRLEYNQKNKLVNKVIIELAATK